MRPALTFVLVIIASINARSQSDVITNSFAETYKKTNPGLHYKYDSKKQTHDYSDNWDLDNDGKKDQVYFIGTGGAHLYYSLKVILSSDNKVRDFPFIESDFPILPNEEELGKADYKPASTRTFFAVSDYNKDNYPDIFVRLEHPSAEAKRKAGVKSGDKAILLIISFKDGKAFFKNYVAKK